MMRKQGPCSRCGFPSQFLHPGSSTWLQNLKPIICNTCRLLMEAKYNEVNFPRKKVPVNEDAEANPLLVNNYSCFIPSTSISHENLAFSVTQIGMIFGNLTFEPTLAIPLILRPNPVKSEVVTAYGNFFTQVQHHFHCGKTSNPSTSVVDSRVKIKQEQESEGEDEGGLIWDVKKVKRKKRSKLPQYTLSPLARFINRLRLRHASYHRRRRRRLGARPVGPKYDDVLIYEKCAMHVPENEIGLGAEQLSPPPLYGYSW